MHYHIYMLSLFLAKRFFKGNKHVAEQHKASPPALRIAMAGIAVGVAVMIISVCLVRGFQREVSGKLSGFAAHIEIVDDNFFGSPETNPLYIDDATIQAVGKAPGVVKVQRMSQKIGLFKTYDNFAGVALKGVGEDYDLSFLKQYMVKGVMPQFSSKRASNEIVISQTLADKLNLHVGDKVFSYYFSQTIKQRRFKVVGIYNTYLKQFDNTYAITDLYTVNQLNSWLLGQCSGLEVKLHSFDYLHPAVSYLSKHIGGKTDRYGHTFSIWGIDRNPYTASTLSWINLLDTNVMVILIIMICVAGFTMVSGLLILILERTNTIGVLKALGASNSRIRHTFLWYASFIVVRGMVWGNVLGLGLILIQQYFHIIHLDPNVYYVTSAPVEINWLWIVGINVVTLVIDVLALIIPSYLVSKIQPAKAIQFD